MSSLRISLAQINTTVGDFSGNSKLILEMAHEAARLGADIVAFPELAICGYPPEDLLLRSSFIEESRIALNQLAKDAQLLPPLIVGSLDFDQHLYNSASILHEGRVIADYHKQKLPNYGVFDEQRYFQAGDSALICTVKGVDIGVNICEDIWYPDGPISDATLAGAQLIVNINASPFAKNRSLDRERMISTRAADHTVAIAYVNQVGGQDELVFDGNSFISMATGKIGDRAPSFEDSLLTSDIEFEEVLQRQLHDSRLRQMRNSRSDGMTSKIERVELVHSPSEKVDISHLDKFDEISTEEEVYRALVTGTRDYLHKSGFEHAFVALSGGIDSALVGAIAVDALGPVNVTGVSMPSRYSSDGSVTDAEDLANRLGVELLSLPIEGVHGSVLDSLLPEFARSDNPDPGVAGENIQSRIRGMLMMALSNHRPRSMVLTTGNKSEYACGYATLYGDMVGGFAVIKDVPKTLVWQLSRWRNSIGEVIPDNSITKAPSAELRPDQLDLDSLPEYDILDPIIQFYVEDDLSFESIVSKGFDEDLVRRVIGMINRNEYKRRQSPPGVKITARAFGRDRRLPMATRYSGI
jgi:NAD+ synthase (glutamine-hydrolysing)